MKILLVIALVVCTGCQANLFYANEPKPQLEQLIDAFRSYFERTKRNDSDRLTDNIDMASQYTSNLKEQMNPLAKDLMTKITEGAGMVKERVETEVNAVRCALKPYTEYVTSPFKKGAEYIRESLDFEDLKATVLEKTEKMRENLEHGMKELQAKLDPST